MIVMFDNDQISEFEKHTRGEEMHEKSAEQPLPLPGWVKNVWVATVSSCSLLLANPKIKFHIDIASFMDNQVLLYKNIGGPLITVSDMKSEYSMCP